MPSAQSISKNERTVVVGDLHGCYDELVALLSDIRFGPNDRVVAVGDLVVKGPKSREILDLFISDPRFSTVIGNQDMGLLRCWRGENPKLTAAQEQACDELEFDRQRYCSYLSSLPLMIDLGSHLVVHAGVRPGVPFTEQSEHDLLWIRDVFLRDRGDFGKIVVHGHTPTPVPESKLSPVRKRLAKVFVTVNIPAEHISKGTRLGCGEYIRLMPTS